MAGCSRSVVSNQSGPHPRLPERVRRHLRHPSRRPPAAHSQAAFAALAASIDPARALVLDAGCGTGASTARLAEVHPEAQVIGIDRSAHRLARRPPLPANARLLRAELADFWRLALAAGWSLQHHYLLYPNPWPKARHLGRRWQGSPLFPVILALGGTLELRSNWRLYLEEWVAALALAGVAAAVEPLAVDSPLTPFECKYHTSGQPLWCCRVRLLGHEFSSSCEGHGSRSGAVDSSR
ncbi:MAG: methyltransferase domain-containing protein [Candidatus Competibacterales bacterium]|nr:methyltransferase domain-containing protein [Candidatus Competibacterales bacterium]